MSEGTNSMTLYRHVKREQWGFAILASEGPNRRRFQFQDGRIRTFKKGFYNLLEEVDEAPEEAVEVLAELQKKLDLSRARKQAIEDAGGSPKQAVTFDDQVRVFRMMYPEGFQDTAWSEGIRGEESSRRLKRHRQQAIDQAAEKLSREALDDMIGKGDFEGVRDAVVEALKRTDLVRPSADLQPIDDLPGDQVEAFARTVRDLLYGEDDFSERFDRFVDVVTPSRGEHPTWQLATVLPALVHPEEHVCVRPSSFRRQSKWLRPRLRYASKPTAKQYLEFQEMAKDARKHLEDAGLKPRDLMDAYDFIRVTLAPKALKRLKGE
ncbi:MAG: hypothetical protein ACQEXJ_04840 [Myxococcota bacterium]